MAEYRWGVGGQRFAFTGDGFSYQVEEFSRGQGKPPGWICNVQTFSPLAPASSAGWKATKGEAMEYIWKYLVPYAAPLVADALSDWCGHPSPRS